MMMKAAERHSCTSKCRYSSYTVHRPLCQLCAELTHAFPVSCVQSAYTAERYQLQHTHPSDLVPEVCLDSHLLNALNVLTP